jgi:hypothetical protein
MQSWFLFRYSLFISISDRHKRYYNDAILCGVCSFQIFTLHFIIWSSSKDIIRWNILQNLLLLRYSLFISISQYHVKIWQRWIFLEYLIFLKFHSSFQYLIVISRTCKDWIFSRVHSFSDIHSSFQYLIIMWIIRKGSNVLQISFLIRYSFFISIFDRHIKTL